MAKLNPKYGKRADGTKYLKYYYAEFYDPTRRPKRKRISLRTKDETAARQKFVQLEREYMAGLRDPWTDRLEDEGLTVAEAVRRFLKNRSEYCADSTVDGYGYVLNPFVESLAPNFPLYGVERRHITRFVERPDLKEATQRSYEDWLRIFFAWCVSEGLTKDNPVPPKRRSKKSRLKSVPEFLTEEQYDTLLRGIEADAVLKNLPHGNEWILDTIRFAVGTGLRRGELVNLRWSAVDLKAGMMTVRNTEDFQTKSGRERTVPLVGDALEVLKKLHAARTSEADDYIFKGATGSQVNDNYLSKRFREYRRLARLPKNIHFHSLRHTFASWFVQRGGDLYRLKEIMGHADMKTTLVYAHLRPDALRAEMEQCFGTGRPAADLEVERLSAELRRAKEELERLQISTNGSGGHMGDKLLQNVA